MAHIKHERKYIFENKVFRKQNEPTQVIFSSVGQMEIGAPVEFGGNGKNLNPEEMFVAAINSCLMNTFFYFTQKYNIDILSYNSQASGRLEKQSDGFRFTGVDVRAKIEISDDQDFDKIQETGKLAEKYCLISRSISCEVDYKLEILNKHI